MCNGELQMATIYGTDDAETINSYDGVTSGSDLIYGFAGDDTIVGLAGQDMIIGGFGADTMDGEVGGYDYDTASYVDSTMGVIVSLATGLGFNGTAQGDILSNFENLNGSAHDDILLGDDASNFLSGQAGNDNLSGGGGADQLYGDNGDDRLKGGGGADTLHGGNGTDTADYTYSTAAVVVSLATGSGSAGDAEGDDLISIENLTGSDYNDVLMGHDGANLLEGGDGADSLKGAGGADTLRGGAGNDVLDGGLGSDTMVGGVGDDTYYVNGSSDVVTESFGQGTDLVRTSYHYTLAANVENLATNSGSGTAALMLTGNGLDNVITGNDGANTINGGAGVDQMIGNGGNDTYTVDNGFDSVVETSGDGTDTVYATVNGHTLAANVEILSLNTGSALSGFGNGLDNELYGNALDNVLDGGDGADELSGLGGNDSFSFVASEAQGDIVYDFDGNDAGVGDLLRFEGYGTLAEGASFTSLGAGQYQVTSADGLISETITLYGTVNIAQDVVFV